MISKDDMNGNPAKVDSEPSMKQDDESMTAAGGQATVQGSLVAQNNANRSERGLSDAALSPASSNTNGQSVNHSPILPGNFQLPGPAHPTPHADFTRLQYGLSSSSGRHGRTPSLELPRRSLSPSGSSGMPESSAFQFPLHRKGGSQAAHSGRT